MNENNAKKYDENGQLSCEMYSSATAARLSLLRLGRRSFHNLSQLKPKFEMLTELPSCYRDRRFTSHSGGDRQTKTTCKLKMMLNVTAKSGREVTNDVECGKKIKNLGSSVF